MTSAQTELLQRLQEVLASHVTAADLFVHAFGQDYPELGAVVATSGQDAGEVAHTIAVWAASMGAWK